MKEYKNQFHVSFHINSLLRLLYWDPNRSSLYHWTASFAPAVELATALIQDLQHLNFQSRSRKTSEKQQFWWIGG